MSICYIYFYFGLRKPCSLSKVRFKGFAVFLTLNRARNLTRFFKLMELPTNNLTKNFNNHRVGIFLLTAGRILSLFWKNFWERKITVLAQSLAYTTIFTLVPILAIFFFVLGKITENLAMRAKIQEFISVYLFPESVAWIFKSLEKLEIDSMVFGAIGFPTLFLTGVFLYVKVDSSINEIWISHKQVKWFKNSLAFFMTLFFGPSILVLVFSIPPYLHNLPYYNEVIQIANIGTIITQLIPFLILFVGLSVLYFYIPVVSVKIHAAIHGAFWAAIAIQISNYLIGIYLNTFAKLDVFYGSLATIPIFLLYVFSFWLIVLSGSTLSYIYQYYQESGFFDSKGTYNNESLLCSALMIMLYLTQCFEKGAKAPDFDQIQLMLRINRNRLTYILSVLKGTRYITSFIEGASNRSNIIRYQPGKTPKNIYLKELIPLFISQKNRVVFNSALNQALQSLEVHPAFHQGNINLVDLLNQPDIIPTDLFDIVDGLVSDS